MSKINLRNYDNSWYHPGRSALWRTSWFFFGLPILRSNWIPFSSLRVWLLRVFGAHIGKRVVVKPGVNVKYPWHLVVGDDTWIGERCWIDNLTTVHIGSSACVSQGVYFCTGNHNWSDPAFGLKIAPIQLGDASWAGAMCVLTPGAVLGEGAIASAGSIVVGTIPDYEIYAGNPAAFVKKRRINTVDVAQPECEVFQ